MEILFDEFMILIKISHTFVETIFPINHADLCI